MRWVQERLNALIDAGLVADGVRGPRTTAAVRQFQQSRGLVADGVVGPRTLAALREGGEPSAQAAPAACTGIAAREVIDHFDFGRADILPRHQPQIVNLAQCILASQRSPTPITTLTVIGHTDPVGSDADNISLGRRRAEAVRDAVIAAIARISGRPAHLAVTIESRGEREQVPGDASLNRRVEVVPPFPFTPTAAAATIEIVLDDDNDTLVDDRAPVATFLRLGIWDQAYDAAGDIRNNQAERDNFVGLERRRFYFRVRDPAATAARITADWLTLRADRTTNDDAPASRAITLTQTRAGSHVFVSKAVMLVTDETDARQDTHSGLAPPLAEANLRHRGQSNHRLRRARIDGFVKAEYRPPGGGAAVSVVLPVFQRRPTDERRRLRVRVINYGTHATAAYIGAQFEHANARWNQIGLAIDPQATTDRPVPPAALDGAGLYAGSANNAFETAALNNLVPVTPDNSITAVFVPMTGANAYATIGERTVVAIANRYFIFINTTLDLEDQTLAHELAHVLFNRFDAATERRFYTLNTNAPTSFGVPLPDTRIYRRIQNRNSPDPDNDAANANIINWARRARTGRFPIGGGLDPATATTGNTLTEAF